MSFGTLESLTVYRAVIWSLDGLPTCSDGCISEMQKFTKWENVNKQASKQARFFFPGLLNIAK